MRWAGGAALPRASRSGGAQPIAEEEGQGEREREREAERTKGR